MGIEPSDLPFRKSGADRRFDALAYCPVCRSTEVQIVKTYTAHGDLCVMSEQESANASLLPGGRTSFSRNHNPAGPWQFVLFFRCGNGHEFDVAFFTGKGLTWAELTHDGHERHPAPKPADGTSPRGS